MITNSTECRYPNYNWGPNDENPYTPNIKFYHIWFARLLFVIFFENIIACTVMALKLLIPDVSGKLKHRIRREAFITTKLIMEKEKERLRRSKEGPGSCRRRVTIHDTLPRLNQLLQVAPMSTTSEVDIQFSEGSDQAVSLFSVAL